MTRHNDATLGESIGSAIKELRIKKYPNHGGQIKCAQDFGVSQAEWSRWERGVKTPSPANQRAIADFFHVSIGQLYGENVGQVMGFSKEVDGTQAAAILGLYRKVTDISVLLANLVHKAEKNVGEVHHTERALESVRSSLEIHLDHEE